MAQCKATTKSGTRCANPASEGSDYCWIKSHGGSVDFEDLSPRRQRFIDEYIICLNGAEAARRAGYSENGARVRASNLLANSNIRAEIDRRLDEVSMTSSEVLARLTQWGRGTLHPFLDDNGRINVTTEEALEYLHLVKKIEIKDGQYKIELVDPMTAVEKIAKIRGMFTEHIEVEGGLKITGVDFD